MLSETANLPLMKDFRHFVLSRFGIPPEQQHTRDCSSLGVLFIWRRNYVAHPRNPSGIIARKISNENEILTASMNAFPNWIIKGVQLDKYEIRQQLELLSNVDIIIGMHGAAFSFAFVLAPGSGVIEMYPKVKNQGRNWHMEAIAKWSKLHYSKWINDKDKYEDTKRKYTYIPPAIVTKYLYNIHGRMCALGFNATI